MKKLRLLSLLLCAALLANLRAVIDVLIFAVRLGVDGVGNIPQMAPGLRCSQTQFYTFFRYTDQPFGPV